MSAFIIVEQFIGKTKIDYSLKTCRFFSTIPLDVNIKGVVKMANVYVLDHPLIQHKLTYIRDKNTGTKEFRELVDEVAMLMAFEITRNLSFHETTLNKHVTEVKTRVLDSYKICLIHCFRAGFGFVG